MSKNMFNFLLLNSAVLGASLVLSSAATAAETATTTELEPSQPRESATPQMQTDPSTVALEDPTVSKSPVVAPITDRLDSGSSTEINQVTSVSQLSDVRPTDWAFQALQNLVERYRCIAGYPDATFRGNRAMTRYEFAAGLNACLEGISQLINRPDTSRLVTKDDLAKLQRLQEEFQAELATLRGRVDALEARAAELEANQFSVTTKLQGEVIVAIGDTFGNAVGATQDNSETFLSHRTRLNFNTSFSGKDLLLTRLQASNTPELTDVTGTQMSRLGFDGSSDNQFVVDKLFYQFPLGRATISVAANGFGIDDAVNTANPYLSGEESGALSRFARFNPAVHRGPDGAGLAVNYKLSDRFNVDLLYLTDNANDPNPKKGLFNGDYSALAQLNFTPSEEFNLALTYARKYHSSADGNLTGSTGSVLGNQPFGAIPTSSNNFGLEGSWRINPRFNLSGWVGTTLASAEKTDLATAVKDGDKATLWNWAVALAFPDLGKKGNLGAIIVGMPPKVTSNDSGLGTDPDTSFHIEALYRYQLTDNIAITPGVFLITAPDHNSNNNAIWVGTLRTTFQF